MYKISPFTNYYYSLKSFYFSHNSSIVPAFTLYLKYQKVTFVSRKGINLCLRQELLP